MPKQYTEEFEQNTFQYWAEKYMNDLTDSRELLNNDWTEMFFQEIQNMLKGGENVIITINGEVRLGKSTCAIQLGKQLFKYMQDNNLTKHKDEFTIKNICRDDFEYSQRMKEETTSHTFLVIDEQDVMEQTGINSSVEQKLRQSFSDLRAAELVHRIFCTPKNIVDQNSRIILECKGKLKSKTKYVTLLALYYRIISGFQEHKQLLGHVKIDVTPLIKTWITQVKPIYYNPRSTKKQLKKIQTIRKKDIYVDYVFKKHDKFELIKKYNITKPRFLDYAKPMLKVIKELEPLTRQPNVLDVTTIKKWVIDTFQDHKLEMSILGHHEQTDEVLATLKLYMSYYKIKKKVKKLLNQFKKTHDQEIKKDMIEQAQFSIKIWEKINESIKRLEKYHTLNEKYFRKL